MRSKRYIRVAAAVIAIAAPSGAHGQSFSYDALGQLVEVRYDATHTIRYENDTLGNVTNFAILSAQAETDDDTDGIADAWELVWFNTFTNTATGDFNRDTVNNLTHYSDQTDPITSDSDGDGSVNWDETFADMDPLDGARHLGITVIDHAASCSVTFHCTNSRVYTLQYATNMADGAWAPVAGQVSVTGESDGEMSLTDPDDTDSRTYRIGIAEP